MAGLDQLKTIYERYSGTGIIGAKKSEMTGLARAIAQGYEFRGVPNIYYVSATQIKIKATAACPARVMMCGFPDVLNPGQFVRLNSGGWEREITASLTIDISQSSSRWGTEKSDQWYMVFLLASGETAFTAKLMPIMRVKSYASNVFSLGKLSSPSTGIGYGFSTDELVGYQVYVLTGNSEGELRQITANNNDNGFGGTITHGGTALSLAQGDWLAVLPPVDFRWVGGVYNDTLGNLASFKKSGNFVYLLSGTWNNDPLAAMADGYDSSGVSLGLVYNKFWSTPDVSYVKAFIYAEGGLM